MTHTGSARDLRVGDAARCKGCGYEFIHRRARGPRCPRCHATDLARWMDSDAPRELGRG